MQKNTLRALLTSTMVLCGLTSGASALADTVIYEALTDFPVIDAGEAPYYKEEARQALAINASREDFRDVFARAEVVFDGQPGIYQIVLVALAEVDGEADYRLLVNGVVVGLASNPEVVEDFSVIRHEFPDIDLPAGALIGVESLANSNGKIPENGEFAFARGRWTRLEVSTTLEAPEHPDLSIASIALDAQLLVGNRFEAVVSVANADNQAVATGVSVSVQRPSSVLELADGSACSETPQTIDCPVAELAAGVSADIAIPLRSTEVLVDVPVSVGVSSDQPDHDEADNARQFILSVSAESEATEEGSTESPETEESSNVEGPSGNEGATVEEESTTTEESSESNQPPTDIQVASSTNNRGGAWSSLGITALLLIALTRVLGKARAQLLAGARIIQRRSSPIF